MLPVMGAELSKLRVEDLRREAGPRPRRRRGAPLRMAIGLYLVGAGLRVMGRPPEPA